MHERENPAGGRGLSVLWDMRSSHILTANLRTGCGHMQEPIHLNHQETDRKVINLSTGMSSEDFCSSIRALCLWALRGSPLESLDTRYEGLDLSSLKSFLARQPSTGDHSKS